MLGNREPRRSAAVRDEILEGLREGRITARHQRDHTSGVTLVGGGPGDPELITVRGLNRLRACEVLVYDRLVSPELVAEAPPWARRIYAGKEAGGPAHDQRAIEALLIREARAGRRVVRLKGGDPFVFGRGGEEALVLRAAGIPFEVVPGVTSGVAAPAYGGIPVTHRDRASAVALVTGHEDPAKPESAIDWPALAAFPGSLVFYMGVKQLPRIAEQLIAGGRSPQEPAAVIERGTLPGQRTVVATLETIAEKPDRPLKGWNSLSRMPSQSFR